MSHPDPTKEYRPELDYALLDDLQFDGIDTNDYPDFCDAYICSATYDGREATEAELEVLNDDRSFVYESLMEHLF